MPHDSIKLIYDFENALGEPRRICFRNPVSVHAAYAVDEVRGVIDAASEAAGADRYAAGFVAYEAGPAFDGALSAHPPSYLPLAWFAIFESPVDSLPVAPDAEYRVSDWTPDIARAEYDDAILQIHSMIAAGATYQVNYTFRMRAAFEGDGLAYYEALQGAHPVRYGAFLDIGSHFVISISPELFLRRTSDQIVAQPMKGTAIRGLYPDEDRRIANRLHESEKDRAENVMIVDLMRSDLGRVALTGSVVTPRLFDVEPLPTVWQMTSRIECQVPPETSLAKLFAATFPPGSVTGAPKPMTTSIIKDMESSPRKVYCGAIGYSGPGQESIFNVAIRTVIIDKSNGAAECGVGGGITSGSQSGLEYEEALAKSKFLDLTTPEFRLLESLLLENGEYFLLDRHLRRLAASAERFGFHISPDSLRVELDTHASAYSCGARKVRLLLSRTGDCEVSSNPIEPNPSVANIALALAPIDTSLPYIYHKTTYRFMYDQHAAGLAGYYDILLWNSSREATEFTRGNIVVNLHGGLLTPPVSCGLLAGTFRDELLDQGVIKERTIMIDDLPDCDEIWFINSVRKWVRVRLSAAIS